MTPLSTAFVLEVPENAIRQKKVIKGKLIGKEGRKLLLYADYITIYVEKTK